METTFKDVVKYGAYSILQYDELYRGERFLVFLNGTQLKPEWVVKTDERILEEITIAIEAITDFDFVIGVRGTNLNTLDDYLFGPKEFVWEVLSLNGVITEAMIESVQLLFFNLNAAHQEIKVYVESFSNENAPTAGEGIVSLPTLNTVILEFYGDRKLGYVNSTFEELLSIVTNELFNTDSDSYTIVPSSVNSENSNFSVKTLINKLDGVNAEPILAELEEFVAELALQSFNTIWLQTSSERFVV